MTRPKMLFLLALVYCCRCPCSRCLGDALAFGARFNTLCYLGVAMAPLLLCQLLVGLLMSMEFSLMAMGAFAIGAWTSAVAADGVFTARALRRW